MGKTFRKNNEFTRKQERENEKRYCNVMSTMCNRYDNFYTDRHFNLELTESELLTLIRVLEAYPIKGGQKLSTKLENVLYDPSNNDW